MKKVILILVAVIGFGFIANAQDVILKKDGSEIEAKVLEITDQQIKYKNFDFQDGPVRNINISEVFVIIYQNGQKEVFNKEPEPIKSTHTTEENTVQNSKKQNSSANENEQCTISVCGLSVACSDAPSMMTWDEAKQKAPKGYRLPTPNELKCMRNGLKPTQARLLAREYWTSEDAIRNKAYTITMDDGKEEKNKRSEKFSVRYVRTSGYEDGANASQQVQTESHRDISNNETSSRSEYTNNQGFILSLKDEIIVDSYGLIDGAYACNMIIKKFEELGFCCVHREDFDKNTTAKYAIAIRNHVMGVGYQLIDHKQNKIVWEDSYSKLKAKAKDKIVGLPYFMESIMPFIGE